MTPRKNNIRILLDALRRYLRGETFNAHFLFPLVSFGQSDTSIVTKKYDVVSKYPFYQYCRNCRIKSPRPAYLCSHDYNIIFAGYSFDKRPWIDIGYSKDFASCYPERGGHLFSISVLGAMENGKMINGIRASYFRDHLLGLQLFFVKLGCVVESYTKYKNVDSVIRPEVRLGDNMFYSKFLTRVQFSYGYNIPLGEYRTVERARHQVSVNLRLLIKGWVS